MPTNALQEKHLMLTAPLAATSTTDSASMPFALATSWRTATESNVPPLVDAAPASALTTGERVLDFWNLFCDSAVRIPPARLEKAGPRSRAAPLPSPSPSPPLPARCLCIRCLCQASPSEASVPSVELDRDRSRNIRSKKSWSRSSSSIAFRLMPPYLSVGTVSSAVQSHSAKLLRTGLFESTLSASLTPQPTQTPGGSQVWT